MLILNVQLFKTLPVPNKFDIVLNPEFTNDMSWKNHINSIASKAYKRLGILRKHKFNLDRCSLDKMYKVFIRPLLEYGNIIWDNCSQENKKSLENIVRCTPNINWGYQTM